MEIKSTQACGDVSIESFLQSFSEEKNISTMNIAGVLYTFRSFMQQNKAPGYLQKTELESLEDLASKLEDFFVKIVKEKNYIT